MIETTVEKREQAATLVRMFCSKPFRDHGRKRTSGPYKGWYQHDWGHIVQRVYRVYFEQALDIASATQVAKPLRSEFPNRGDWEARLSSPHVQARILQTIEEGIAPLAPQTESASTEPASSVAAS